MDPDYGKPLGSGSIQLIIAKKSLKLNMYRITQKCYPNWLTLKHADPHNRDYLVPVLLSAHYRTWRNSPGTSSRQAAELAPDDGGHLVPQHGQNSADRTRLLFYMVNILHMCRISISYTGGNSFYKRSVL